MKQIYKSFFNTIGSTSAFEAIRKTSKVDINKLQNSFNNAKFSNLGTPVVDYVELALYEDLEGRVGIPLTPNSSIIGNSIKSGISNQIYQHGINENVLHLNEVNVTTNMTMNIIRTSVNGRNGTFKEFYNQGDLLITLSGSLTGPIAFQNDIQNLNNFSRLYLGNQRFNIKSNFINDTFNVFDVIMSDFTLTLNDEYNNVVDYTITLESDNDIEIIF